MNVKFDSTKDNREKFHDIELTILAKLRQKKKILKRLQQPFSVSAPAPF